MEFPTPACNVNIPESQAMWAGFHRTYKKDVVLAKMQVKESLNEFIAKLSPSSSSSWTELALLSLLYQPPGIV